MRPLALLLLAACATTRPPPPAAAPTPSVRVRPLGDAFVDDFDLPRPAIRALMPFNIGDDRHVVASRSDHFDSVLQATQARGRPWTKPELFAAFYDNQEAFNRDPARNRVGLHGVILERSEGGKTIVTCALRYERLPMSVYTTESWNKVLPSPTEVGDPRELVKVVERGEGTASLYLELELPAPGAPLDFWAASESGRVRVFRYTAVGEGQRVNGGPALIVVHEVDEGRGPTSSVTVTPLEP